jgi:succinate-semialdehyde dehydrogenase/glutarate-semialdehyde dehydrogenase
MTHYKLINPSTEEIIEEYELQTFEEAASLTEKGYLAHKEWRSLSFEQRGIYLHKLADIMEREKDNIAKLIATEMGKPVGQGGLEIDRCILICRYTADEEYKVLQDEERPLAVGSKGIVSYEPLGVVLGIQPWNFPLSQIIRYTAPCLMAGNAVLLKHAPNVWGMARKVQEMIEEAGFPKGLFQSLYLDNETTSALIGHDKIRAVAFTGSARGGAAVAEKAGQHIKKCVLELGGSDPYIILDDADLDLAVATCVRARTGNAGQICIAAKRFIVHEKIYEEFKERFLEAMSQVTYGDPLDEETQMGPMARTDLREGLHGQVLKSIEMGAKALLGCEMPEGKGYFYPASVLEISEINRDMPAYKEELFGPVAALFKVRNAKEAVALANDHEYGLGAGVFTQNEDAAIDIAKQIESGIVNVNGFFGGQPNMPFGGVKNSGYGREHGGFGIREFVNIKSIMVG